MRAEVHPTEFPNELPVVCRSLVWNRTAQIIGLEKKRLPDWCPRSH
jgi:hypothetical protein